MLPTPPFFERLYRQLMALPPAVVQLDGWPASGRLALLEAWEGRADAVRLEPKRLESARTEAAEPPLPLGSANWLVVPGRTDEETWSRLAPTLGPWVRAGGRAVVATDRAVPWPPDCEAAPMVAAGHGLRLDRGELEGWWSRSGVSEERLDGDALLRETDGWFGPLHWLRARCQPGDDPLQVCRSPAFLEQVAREVIARLSPGVARVLPDLAWPESIDAMLWRSIWQGDDSRLRALQEVIDVWTLGGDRLPPVLRAACRRQLTTERSPAEQRSAHRRYADAARAHGRRAEADRHARLASTPAPLVRMEADPEETAGRGSVPAVHLELGLLGAPRTEAVAADGRRMPVVWRLRRSLRIVAMLALADERRVTRDALIEGIWPDAYDETVRKNLHPTLSDVRRTLRTALGTSLDPIVYAQGTYALQPRIEVVTDVDRFESEVAQGVLLLGEDPDAGASVATTWRQAWRRYRGPLLEGEPGAWLEAPRARLHQRYLDLLERLGRLALTLGEHTEALDALRTALLEDPFAEDLHRAVMEVYGAQDRRDLVRAQFVRLQDRLKELGVVPSAETLERYHELMA